MSDPKSDASQLQRAFLGWQCRLRQLAVRDHGGRPGAGMMPGIQVDADGDVPERIVVLIVQRDPLEMTAQFRHIHRSVRDPRARYERALALLRTGYFQHPEEFSDVMTALFGPDSAAAEALIRARRCVLEFDHYGQRYRVPCQIARLDGGDPVQQATYWHNILFSPQIAAHSVVLAFAPDWLHAKSDP